MNLFDFYQYYQVHSFHQFEFSAQNLNSNLNISSGFRLIRVYQAAYFFYLFPFILFQLL